MVGRSFISRFIPFAAIVSLIAAAALSAQPPSQPPGDPAARVTTTRLSGSDLFKTYCASCHGRSAKGDGPLAAHMKQPPPDLTRFAERNGGVYPTELVRKIIDGRQPLSGHGGRDMPAWGDAFQHSHGGLTEEEVSARIDALVRHLEAVQTRLAGSQAPSGPTSAP